MTPDGPESGPKAASERTSAHKAAVWAKTAKTAKAALAVLCLLFSSVSLWRDWTDVSFAERSTAFYDPANGTFQNFDPIRRMEFGQRPIRDFDVFIGLGPVALEYGAFKAFGGTTYVDGKMAATASHLGVFVLSGLVLGAAAGLPWWGSLALTSAFLGCILHPGLSSVLSWAIGSATGSPTRASPWSMVYAPETNFGLRASLPEILAGLLLLLTKAGVLSDQRRGRAREACLLGACAGLAPAWSNDYGAPAALFVGVWWLLLNAPASPRDFARSSFLFLASAASSLLLVLSLAAGGAPWRWFSYSAEISAHAWDTAYWAPDNVEVDLLRRMSSPVVWPAIGMFVLGAFLAIRRKSAAGAALLLCAGAELAAYAVKVEAWYLFDRYTHAAIRLWPFAAAAAVGWLPKGAPRSVLLAFGAFVCLGVLSVAVLEPMASGGRVGWMFARATWPGRMPVAELGGDLNPGWASLVSASRSIRSPEAPARGPDARAASMFSVYATGPQEISGLPNPGRFDMFIHVPGPESMAGYAADFVAAAPDLAATLDRRTLGYEAAGERRAWPLYKEIYLRYDPILRAPSTVFWRRREAPRTQDGREGACAVEPGPSPSRASLAVDLPEGLPAGERWYAEISYKASVGGRGRRMVLIDESSTDLDAILSGGAPTMLWGVAGDLPSVVHPIQAKAGTRAVLRLSAHAGASPTLGVSECSVRLFAKTSELRAPSDPKETEEKTLPWGTFSMESSGVLALDPGDVDSAAPGSEVEIDGRRAKVLGVFWGRLMLDRKLSAKEGSSLLLVPRWNADAVREEIRERTEKASGGPP